MHGLQPPTAKHTGSGDIMATTEDLLKLLRDWNASVRGSNPSFFLSSSGDTREHGLRLMEKTAAVLKDEVLPSPPAEVLPQKPEKGTVPTAIEPKPIFVEEIPEKVTTYTTPWQDVTHAPPQDKVLAVLTQWRGRQVS